MKEITSYPNSQNTLINTNKVWLKGINTATLLRSHLTDFNQYGGVEIDAYFVDSLFLLHHDEETVSSFSLDSFFEIYCQQKMTNSIWIDFKNLDKKNAIPSLEKLVSFRNKYVLMNKIIVESHNPTLLNSFSENGFYTVFYTPFFNPYNNTDSQNKILVDSLNKHLQQNKINAISGYYFQEPLLKEAFPNYPILIWQANDKYSLINRFYSQKVKQDKSIYISLLF